MFRTLTVLVPQTEYNVAETTESGYTTFSAFSDSLVYPLTPEEDRDFWANAIDDAIGGVADTAPVERKPLLFISSEMEGALPKSDSSKSSSPRNLMDWTNSFFEDIISPMHAESSESGLSKRSLEIPPVKTEPVVTSYPSLKTSSMKRQARKTYRSTHVKKESRELDSALIDEESKDVIKKIKNRQSVERHRQKRREEEILMRKEIISLESENKALLELNNSFSSYLNLLYSLVG